jgi:hypothetical protein
VVIKNGVIVGRGVVGSGMLVGGRNYHPIGANRAFVDPDQDVHYGRQRKTFTAETFTEDRNQEKKDRRLSEFHVNRRIKTHPPAGQM